jgi:D-alanine--poly(phosphoribitol) ligase subunit 1
MYIQGLVRAWVEGAPRLYDAGYRAISPERLRIEFERIRHRLVEDHSEGDIVALQLPRDERYLLSLLACLDIGLTYIPLRMEWPEARIEQIRQLSGFVTVVDERYVERALQGSSYTGQAGSFDLSPDKPLYYMFTSGSTGEPKGVAIKRDSYGNFLSWLTEHFVEVAEEDRLLNSTDYTFDVSMAEVGLLLVRHPQFYVSNFSDDLFTLLNELHELRITVIATVPNNFMVLLDEKLLGRADLKSLRTVLIAGARFPKRLYEKFRNYLPKTRIHNCYGPTEATVYCLAQQLTFDDNQDLCDGVVTIGRPILGCTALIHDGKRIVTQPMQQGELLVGGVQVMSGYLNNRQVTKDAFISMGNERYYRTGDVVFANEHGLYFMVGRTDDTVKVAGQRVNLSDVDAYIQRLEYITDCATISIPDESRGARLIIYVTTSRETSESEIRTDLRSVLVKHQQPHSIVIVDDLPLNNSGKVSKRTLGEWYRVGR